MRLSGDALQRPLQLLFHFAGDLAQTRPVNQGELDFGPIGRLIAPPT
ncbi:hypothetical protein ACFL3H_10560 [Gemmatimonadota bacterium]